jgi:hypothetical protein
MLDYNFYTTQLAESKQNAKINIRKLVAMISMETSLKPKHFIKILLIIW